MQPEPTLIATPPDDDIPVVVEDEGDDEPLERNRLFTADEVSSILKRRLKRQEKKFAAQRDQLIGEVARQTARFLAGKE